MTRIILVSEVGQERARNLQITILQPYSSYFTLFCNTFDHICMEKARYKFLIINYYNY